MKVQRLAWAGLFLQEGETVILIDPIQQVPAPTSHVVGQPLERLTHFSKLPRPSAILTTHLHADHFDPESAIQAFGHDLPFFVPHSSLEATLQKGLTQVTGMNVGDQTKIGEFLVTAVQSIDGFGNPQVAWIVETKTQRVIHCGDTVWHGYFWEITKRYGPFDIAFLPVNGAVLDIPTHQPPSRLPACLTPEQAVEAAHILQAKKLVPIHYKTFHHPPFYLETEDLEKRLQQAARESQVEVMMAEAGDFVL
ncbi:MBL fold metallo-hydrolase [Brevibacillus fluminis]|uniref:MBL fold metallo-hydrolase n=1 Tax=Brevibacillus fluminis TaxID=511487 RepID=A0A3M8DZW9_9BACL|nr:MBL fold metallo-hydrolase [Brevibacillus fluminis]RNB92537.1 MBL fold metallo-hydrolase [Brevibacillus fluminis]